MDPAVQQYLETVKIAKDARDATLARLNTEAQNTHRMVSWALREAANDRIWRDRNTAQTVYKQAQTQAWEGLRESDDPMVHYIADHCYEYPDHAEQILAILPADYAAMRRVAYAQGWCEVFDRFAAGAIRKRLLTDDRSAARRALEKHVHHEYGSRAIAALDPLIQAIVDDAVKQARKAWTAEQKVKAKADKQSPAKVSPAT